MAKPLLLLQKHTPPSSDSSCYQVLGLSSITKGERLNNKLQFDAIQSSFPSNFRRLIEVWNPRQVEGLQIM
jgi:hypothetical protein